MVMEVREHFAHHISTPFRHLSSPFQPHTRCRFQYFFHPHARWTSSFWNIQRELAELTLEARMMGGKLGVRAPAPRGVPGEYEHLSSNRTPI